MTRYDLRTVAEQYRGPFRRPRWVVAGVVGYFGLFAIYFVVRIILAGHPTIPLAIGLGFLIFMIGGSSWMLWLLAPPAEFVDVDENRLNFGYPNGKIKSLLWADPKFRLVLGQTSTTMDQTTQGKPRHVAADRRVFQNYLTGEAYQAIIDQALSHGLAFSERPSPRRGWTQLTITRAAR
jgi:hypothetical protein